MADFESSQYGKRASDHGGGGPPYKEIMEALAAMQADIREIKHGLGGIRTSFVRNDLGDPDFDGHRMDHLRRMKKDEVFEGMKYAGTAKFIGAVLAAVAGVFVTGLHVHIQKLLP